MNSLFAVLFVCSIFGCQQQSEAPSAEKASAAKETHEMKENPASVEVTKSDDPHRIVTVPGNVTETVFALGMGEHIVGACASSRYPDAVETIPKVGYRSNLNAEGVLSLAPTMVIVTDEAGPEEVISQIREAGVRVEVVASERSLEGAVQRIHDVGALLNKKAEADGLVAKIEQEMVLVASSGDGSPAKPKVLFIYVARNTSMVAGSGTAAEAMIGLAGGINAVSSFKEFKPINPEAIVEANPDFILLDHAGLKSLGGMEGALKLPGVAETTAGQKQQIIAMDKTLLLGFGPRLSEGATELARLINQ